MHSARTLQNPLPSLFLDTLCLARVQARAVLHQRYGDGDCRPIMGHISAPELRNSGAHQRQPSTPGVPCCSRGCRSLVLTRLSCCCACSGATTVPAVVISRTGPAMSGGLSMAVGMLATAALPATSGQACPTDAAGVTQLLSANGLQLPSSWSAAPALFNLPSPGLLTDGVVAAMTNKAVYFHSMVRAPALPVHACCFLRRRMLLLLELWFEHD
jgi:hypothetical protein